MWFVCRFSCFRFVLTFQISSLPRIVTIMLTIAYMKKRSFDIIHVGPTNILFIFTRVLLCRTFTISNHEFSATEFLFSERIRFSIGRERT